MSPSRVPPTPRIHVPMIRRPAFKVMRLSRLGALHQTRLSFMRQLTRRMARKAWSVTRSAFEIDARGVGHAVYTVDTGARRYALVAFGHDLPAEARSDRVIAEAWDATFALFDGEPSADDIARLAANVPRQEAGRVTERELCLSRANRSVRLWEHVVERLSQGAQPDAEKLDEVGYLMRTTAVYGSGKFGAADRAIIEERPELSVPFQAEMLTVYLIRTFVRDLVEHVARAQGGDRAVHLDPALAERLGIGNSTGLGMAPFIVNHPILFNNWILAREEAIARVRAIVEVRATDWAQVEALLQGMAVRAAGERSTHPLQVAKSVALARDLATLLVRMADGPPPERNAWDGLTRWAEETLSEEGQECLLSVMLEPYGDMIDGLGHCMSDHLDQSFRIDGSVPVGRVRGLLAETFGWALHLDWSDPAATARAWYVSEEKLEPRLGERHAEPIEAYEQPLATARDAAAAYHALAQWPEETPVAQFLLRAPEHRLAVRRAQIAGFAPYSEIRDNLIDAQMKPVDMLRAKLSFFGATDFDPRSDRWVRIRMFAGAPYPEALTREQADLWIYGAGPLAGPEAGGGAGHQVTET